MSVQTKVATLRAGIVYWNRRPLHYTDIILAPVAELAAISTIDPPSGLRNARLSNPAAASLDSMRALPHKTARTRDREIAFIARDHAGTEINRG